MLEQNEFSTPPCEPNVKPEGSKETGQIRAKCVLWYWNLAQAISQTLLMFLLTPLRILFREDDLKTLLRPMLIPMMEMGRSMAIGAGLAREVMQSEGETYIMKCGRCGDSSVPIPASVVMCRSCSETLYNEMKARVGDMIYLVVCDGCRMILADSDGTMEECNAYARSAGWKVVKTENSAHQPYTIFCPACAADLSPELAGASTSGAQGEKV